LVHEEGMFLTSIIYVNAHKNNMGERRNSHNILEGTSWKAVT